MRSALSRSLDFRRLGVLEEERFSSNRGMSSEREESEAFFVDEDSVANLDGGYSGQGG